MDNKFFRVLSSVQQFLLAFERAGLGKFEVRGMETNFKSFFFGSDRIGAQGMKERFKDVSRI